MTWNMPLYPVHVAMYRWPTLYHHCKLVAYKKCVNKRFKTIANRRGTFHHKSISRRERTHTPNWWMLRWMCVRVFTSICGMYLDYLSEVIYLHRIISRLDHIINLSSTATCYFTLTYTQPSIRFWFFFLSQAHARTLKCTTLLIINVHPNLLICLKQFYLTFYFAHMMCILISYDFFLVVSLVWKNEEVYILC